MQYLDKIVQKRLGDILIHEEIISPEQLKDCLREQERTGGLLGEILVNSGLASEWDIAKAISKQYQIPFILTDRYNINPDVLGLFTLAELRQHLFVPLDRFGEIVTIAVAGALTTEIVTLCRARTGNDPFVYVGLGTDIRNTLEREFSPPAKAKAAPAPGKTPASGSAAPPTSTAR